MVLLFLGLLLFCLCAGASSSISKDNNLIPWEIRRALRPISGLQLTILEKAISKSIQGGSQATLEKICFNFKSKFFPNLEHVLSSLPGIIRDYHSMHSAFRVVHFDECTLALYHADLFGDKTKCTDVSVLTCCLLLYGSQLIQWCKIHIEDLKSNPLGVLPEHLKSKNELLASFLLIFDFYLKIIETLYPSDVYDSIKNSKKIQSQRSLVDGAVNEFRKTLSALGRVSITKEFSDYWIEFGRRKNIKSDPSALPAMQKASYEQLREMQDQPGTLGLPICIVIGLQTKLFFDLKRVDVYDGIIMDYQKWLIKAVLDGDIVSFKSDTVTQKTNNMAASLGVGNALLDSAIQSWITSWTHLTILGLSFAYSPPALQLSFSQYDYLLDHIKRSKEFLIDHLKPLLVTVQWQSEKSTNVLETIRLKCEADCAIARTITDSPHYCNQGYIVLENINRPIISMVDEYLKMMKSIEN